MKTLLLILSSAALLADDLRTYSGRVEYTSQGTCDCFYLTLSEKRGWGKMTKDPQPHDGERLAVDWLGDKDQDLVVRPAYGPDGWWPQQAIKLARGAKPRAIASFKWRDRPHFQTLITLYEFRHRPQVPPDEVALVHQNQARPIPILWHLPGGNAAWGYVSKPQFRGLGRFVDPSGGAPSNAGKYFISVFDMKTHEPVLQIEATYRRFGGLFEFATLLDGRYLILPATLRQEIVYVCDLESKRIP